MDIENSEALWKANFYKKKMYNLKIMKLFSFRIKMEPL